MKLTIKHFPKLNLPFLLSLLLFTACQDDEPAMDNDDQEDVQITVTELDEGELQALVGEEILTAETVSATLSDDYFAFSVVFSDERGLTILTDTLRKASFDFNQNGQANSAVFAENITDENPVSYTSEAAASSGGSIDFTHVDLDERIISGTFELTLHAEHDTDEVVTISSAAFNAIPFTIQEESQGAFKATVDGEDWSAEEVTAIVNRQVDVLDVKGTTENGVNISIFMPSDIQPGVYALSGNGDYVATVYPEGEDVGTHFSSTGELTIIEHDQENNIIEATFHFDATRNQDEKVYVVENGEFSYDGY